MRTYSIRIRRRSIRFYIPGLSMKLNKNRVAFWVPLISLALLPGIGWNGHGLHDGWVFACAASGAVGGALLGVIASALSVILPGIRMGLGPVAMTTYGALLGAGSGCLIESLSVTESSMVLSQEILAVLFMMGILIDRRIPR